MPYADSRRSGFGAVRVPVEHGGRGATLVELTQLWIELAAVDANLPQALRGHFALVEDRLWQHAPGLGPARLARSVRGRRDRRQRLVGGRRHRHRHAAHEAGAGCPTASFRLDGTKYYTTGSIFAEWADVYVRVRQPRRARRGRRRVRHRHRRHPGAGVSVVDDWNGFGQRGTGSGTTTFENVRVPATHVLPFAERFPYQTGLYQLNLLATLVGIGRAALDRRGRAGARSHPQLLPRQRPARARRRPGAGQDRRHRRRGLRRRGRHHPGGRQPPAGRRATHRPPRARRGRRGDQRDRDRDRAGRGDRPGPAGRRATSSTRSAPRPPRGRWAWTATGATRARSRPTTPAS